MRGLGWLEGPHRADATKGMNRARQVSLQTGKPVSGELLEDGDLSLQAEVIFVHQLLDDPSTHCQAHS